jgi:hydroxymethylglutaryl-CoA reductase (NADPH)
MNHKTITTFANIPMQWVGPVRISGPVMEEELPVPLATFESPLWPSVNRGARVSVLSGGILAVVTDERMTRSVVIEAANAEQALKTGQWLLDHQQQLAEQVTLTSRFCRLIDCHIQYLGNLLYVRFEFDTADASGHNMVTKAADRLLQWILQQDDRLRYVSISANYCTDKKVSAVNSILGRGKHVVAELIIPEKICNRYLKTTPARMVDLHIKKNLLGSILAGSLRSANAHVANMLLAFYLATGQDAANIVEGSQAMVHSEQRGADLYFSVTLPNIIVGTVGNGKELDFVQTNLQRLSCLESRAAGENARRLAVITAAVVLCGELSLLAAQTNPGELMAAHEKWERS